MHSCSAMVESVATTRRTLSASTLIGNVVRNRQDEALGKVEDFMIDLETGRVAYVVLSFGGFLGVGNKLFAVPSNAFTLDSPRHAFILDVSKERLEEAPGFDKDHRPDVVDAEARTRIFRFYGVTPDWD
jgi:sporulation protein YlmC with PRC-barrel domain